MKKNHHGQTETEPRSCHKCLANFSTKSELMNHVCGITIKTDVFECENCDKKYDSYKLLQTHLKNSHEKDILTDKPKQWEDLKFECSKCPIAYSSFLSLRRHILRTHVTGKETPFPCQKCEKGFYARKNLRQHDVKYHSSPPMGPRNMNPVNRKRKYQERTVPCPQCELFFPTLNMVESHIRKLHDPNFNVACTVCSRQFESTRTMNKHIKTVHHKEKRFICEICSKSFVYASTLRGHRMSQHEKNESLQCKKCDHYSADPNSLRKHIAIMHNKDSLKFKCPVCGQMAISQSALNTHILGRHTNKRPYSCSECDKSYIHSSSLRVHMMSHTGERPFKCQFCQKGFCTNMKRNTHEEDMHSTGKPYQCEKCGKSFPSKHYLQTHDYGIHRKRQKNPMPEKILINEELLKEAISQNTAEIVITNAIGLNLEQSLQQPKDT